MIVHYSKKYLNPAYIQSLSISFHLIPRAIASRFLFSSAEEYQALEQIT